MAAHDTAADERLLAALADPEMAGATSAALAHRVGSTPKAVRNRLARLSRQGHEVPGRDNGRPPRFRPKPVERAERDRLVAEHIELAEYFSRNHRKRFPSHEEDILGAARVGLLKAAATFDPAVGAQFATHACWKIRGELDAWLGRDLPFIRTPHHWNYRSFREDPRNAERLADRARLRRCRAVGVAGADDAADLMLALADRTEREPAPDDRLAPLLAAMGGLRPRDREVVARRFGFGGAEPMTLEEVGRAMGVTKERARQIEQRAMRLLREAMGV